MMDETYTPEQLRRVAVAIERMHGETLTVEWRDHQAGLLRAFADALEENARLKERVAIDDTEREYRRQSLANEIRETLKVRGHFAAERPSDLIGCVARAIESERDRANLAEAELAAERERADRLIAFLADDALAITYQSLAQYRQAAIDAALRK